MDHYIGSLLEEIIFEHPETALQALMRALTKWIAFSGYRSLSSLAYFLEESMKNEKGKRLLGQGFYQRKDFPANQKFPLLSWKRVDQVSVMIFDYLKQLPKDKAAQFYTELAVAWFYSTPEDLLRLAPEYLIVDYNHRWLLNEKPIPTDIEIAEALFLWFHLYLTDPKWLEY